MEMNQGCSRESREHRDFGTRFAAGLGVIAGIWGEALVLRIAGDRGVLKDLPPIENIVQLFSYHPGEAVTITALSALAMGISASSAWRLLRGERDYQAPK